MHKHTALIVAIGMINKPGEAWVEKKGDQRLELIPEVDIDHLLGLGRLVAQSTDQKFLKKLRTTQKLKIAYNE